MTLVMTRHYPDNPEVAHALLPGWHACLQAIAARDTPQSQARRIAAAHWPAATRAGRGAGTRALPYSRTRALARPGLTIAQAIARGACPRYLRHAIARGWLVLEAAS